MIDNLFTTEIGSTIWQMRHPKSDTDLFRVYVASTEEILKGTANTKSKFTQKDNTDIALHEIGKVVEQLLKGNFNFLVGVMSPLTVSVARSPLTEFYLNLQNIVKENVSKNCYHSIHGLAVHNYKKHIYSGKDDSKRRCNKILRVLQFGKTLLDTGKFKFEQFKYGTPEKIIEWMDWLNEAYKYSQLPEKPDETFYRAWLYNLRLYDLRFSNVRMYNVNDFLEIVDGKRIPASKEKIDELERYLKEEKNG